MLLPIFITQAFGEAAAPVRNPHTANGIPTPMLVGVQPTCSAPSQTPTCIAGTLAVSGAIVAVDPTNTLTPTFTGTCPPCTGTPTPTFTGTSTHTPTFTITPYVAIKATDTPTYTSAQLTSTFTPTPAIETAKVLSSVATPVATPVVTAITTPRPGYTTILVARTINSTGTNPGSAWFFKGSTGYPINKIGVGVGYSYLLYSDGGNRNLGIGLPGELASEISLTYYFIYLPYGQTSPAWFLE